MSADGSRAGERLYTPGEFAAIFRVSRSTVYRWIAEGRIAVTRTPGGFPRIPASALEPRGGEAA